MWFTLIATTAREAPFILLTVLVTPVVFWLFFKLLLISKSAPLKESSQLKEDTRKALLGALEKAQIQKNDIDLNNVYIQNEFDQRVDQMITLLDPADPSSPDKVILLNHVKALLSDVITEKKAKPSDGEATKTNIRVELAQFKLRTIPDMKPTPKQDKILGVRDTTLSKVSAWVLIIGGIVYSFALLVMGVKYSESAARRAFVTGVGAAYDYVDHGNKYYIAKDAASLARQSATALPKDKEKLREQLLKHAEMEEIKATYHMKMVEAKRPIIEMLFRRIAELYPDNNMRSAVELWKKQESAIPWRPDMPRIDIKGEPKTQ